MKYAKYIHVLELLHSIPVGPAKRWHTDPQIRATVDEEQALAVWDHLFTYIHANWLSPASGTDRFVTKTVEVAAEIRECRELLTCPANELMERLEKIPPDFSESAFPVAVGRYLLRELALPFNHRKSKTFKEFHDRYGRMILDY